MRIPAHPAWQTDARGPFGGSGLYGAFQAGQPPSAAVAVRNERPARGTRCAGPRAPGAHRKGAHDAYYRAPAGEGRWWAMGNGADRHPLVVGQGLRGIERERPPKKKRVPPESSSSDDAYRLARYANIEHWRATRDPAQRPASAGNGRDRDNESRVGGRRPRWRADRITKGAILPFRARNAPDTGRSSCRGCPKHVRTRGPGGKVRRHLDDPIVAVASPKRRARGVENRRDCDINGFAKGAFRSVSSPTRAMRSGRGKKSWARGPSANGG
jgi:hypothetical protein